MEVGAPGLNGVSAAWMGKFRGRGAATILHLYLGLLVRERTNRRKTVVSLIHLNNSNNNKIMYICISSGTGHVRHVLSFEARSNA